MDGFEWKKERKRRVPQRDGAITGVPSSNAFTLSINQQGNSARLRRYSQTPSSCRKQELATEALPLQGDIYGQATKPEYRDLIASQALLDHVWRTLVSNGSGTEAVKPQNFAVPIIDCQERLRPTPLVTLACVALQERV